MLGLREHFNSFFPDRSKPYEIPKEFLFLNVFPDGQPGCGCAREKEDQPNHIIRFDPVEKKWKHVNDCTFEKIVLFLKDRKEPKGMSFSNEFPLIAI